MRSRTRPLQAKQLVDDMLFDRVVRKRRELEQRMHVDKREGWLLEDLKAYDGRDPDSPILLAIDGHIVGLSRGFPEGSPQRAGVAWSFAGTGTVLRVLKLRWRP